MVMRDGQTDWQRRSEDDGCNREETTLKDEEIKHGGQEERWGNAKTLTQKNSQILDEGQGGQRL